MLELWAYLNRPIRQALVHVGQCSYANRGRGIQPGSTDSKELRGNGMWIGPLPENLSLIETSTAVQDVFAPAVFGGAGKWNVRPCGHCGAGR